MLMSQLLCDICFIVSRAEYDKFNDLRKSWKDALGV